MNGFFRVVLMLPLMAMGVSVAVLPAVAAEKAEFREESGKNQKKSKLTKNDSGQSQEKQHGSDKEALKRRFGEVMIDSACMEDMPIDDFVAYLQAEATKGGIDVVVKYVEEPASKQPIVTSLKLNAVTLEELIDCATNQMGAVYTVEGNVLTFYSSRHRWTRTYKVREDELRAYLGITVDDSLEEALSDIGFSYPMDSKLTAGNKNTITLKSSLVAHEEMETLAHEVETLRADSVKAGGIYKRAHAALNKAAKSMSRIDSSNSTKAGKAVVKVEEALKNAVPDEQGCRMLRIYLVNAPSAAKRYRKALENARTMFDMLEGDLLEVNSSAVRNSLTRLSDYLQKLDF